VWEVQGSAIDVCRVGDGAWSPGGGMVRPGPCRQVGNGGMVGGDGGVVGGVWSPVLRWSGGNCGDGVGGSHGTKDDSSSELSSSLSSKIEKRFSSFSSGDITGDDG
jgi:hypothetical protein